MKKLHNALFKSPMKTFYMEGFARANRYDISLHQLLIKTSSKLGVTSKKTSIFKDIAQIGGGEVNPMSKN